MENNAKEDLTLRVARAVEELYRVKDSETLIQDSEGEYYHGMYIGNHAKRKLAERQVKFCEGLIKMLEGECEDNEGRYRQAEKNH
jgi:hypothetical protein